MILGWSRGLCKKERLMIGRLMLLVLMFGLRIGCCEGGRM